MKTRNLFLALFIFASAETNAQWEPDVRLTVDPLFSYTTVNHTRCVAASGDTVHVVWNDKRDGNDEIYYKRSTDAGITWGADTRLTLNSYTSEYPSVSVSGSVVNVIWDDGRDGNYEIYYKRSTDGGTTWGADTRLTSDLAVSWLPSVSVSDSDVHVTWWDSRDGNEEIYHKRSTDGGITWGADDRLTSNSADSKYPSVSSSALFVHVAWEDNRDGIREIYYKRSTDGGITWGADTRLTSNSASSLKPNVSVSGSVVHIVWDDDRDGNEEIYYKRSTDGGITWGADTRLTSNSSISLNPSISVSGAVVHTVWTDTRDGNYEIYYKRDITGNPLVINKLSIDNLFSIAPNPAHNYFTFSVNTQFASANSNGASEIEIFNSLGEKIYSEVLRIETQTINCKYFSPGIYFVIVRNQEKWSTKKLIIRQE